MLCDLVEQSIQDSVEAVSIMGSTLAKMSLKLICTYFGGVAW